MSDILILTRVASTADTDRRTGRVDGQYDGLRTSPHSALEVIPGDVEVVVGVDLCRGQCSSVHVSRPLSHLLEDDLTSVEGVVALDGVKLLNGLGREQCGLCCVSQA